MADIEGYPNEEAMIIDLEERCRNSTRTDPCRVIGCIVFTDLPTDGSTLPKEIEYTIRVVSSGEVRRTRKFFPHKMSSEMRKFEAGGTTDKLIIKITFINYYTP